MRLLLLAMLIAIPATAAVAPSFQGDTLSGDRVVLGESIKPGRTVLVSFWATWCVPCLEELRQISENLKGDPSVPVDVVTVNVDTSETASDIRPTVRLQNLLFPVVLDPSHEIFNKYNPTKTLPFSVLVGPGGEIEATFNGYHESMFQQLKVAVAKAVAKAATREVARR